MRGIINRAINERLSPGVNAPVSASYEEGEVVDVRETVLGDLYDGENVWYKLNTGGYVWSGGVYVQRDFSGLKNEKDRDQFLISYRKIKRDARPDLDTKEPPDRLYFTPLRLPADTESIRVNELTPEVWVQGIIDSIKVLNDNRKHVFIYIHGYQLFSSLKLDLLSSFVLNYMNHPANKIAKVLFMAWPGQGGPGRKTVDDRSIRAGQQFTENKLFRYFEILSDKLKEEQKYLNLVIHSFGHQLLNGMLNPEKEQESIPQRPIFENVFLMAPDVSHITVKKFNDIKDAKLRNYFKDNEGKDYYYQYSLLPKMANKVYVFHDKYDYLLYSSTKKFVNKGELNKAMTKADRLAITSNYRNLGNYGNCLIDQADWETGFEYRDVTKLVENAPLADLSDYPFQDIRKGPGKNVDTVWTDEDYDGINALRIIFNGKRFPDHHRYLFTCKPVVDEVLSLLK